MALRLRNPTELCELTQLLSDYSDECETIAQMKTLPDGCGFVAREDYNEASPTLYTIKKQELIEVYTRRAEALAVQLANKGVDVTLHSTGLLT